MTVEIKVQASDTSAELSMRTCVKFRPLFDITSFYFLYLFS